MYQAIKSLRYLFYQRSLLYAKDDLCSSHTGRTTIKVSDGFRVSGRLISRREMSRDKGGSVDLQRGDNS
jgi:hypothetical protein